MPLSTADHVAAAARAAREAFREWSEVPVPERVKVLYTFREAFLDNRDTLVRQVTLENGKITPTRRASTAARSRSSSSRSACRR